MMTSVASLLESYEVARPAPHDRPWVLLNLVLSADGHASIDGRVTRLTSPTDQMLFHHLRSLCDVILVGASTVRAEKYGPVRITEEQARHASPTDAASDPHSPSSRDRSSSISTRSPAPAKPWS